MKCTFRVHPLGTTVHFYWIHILFTISCVAKIDQRRSLSFTLPPERNFTHLHFWPIVMILCFSYVSARYSSIYQSVSALGFPHTCPNQGISHLSSAGSSLSVPCGYFHVSWVFAIFCVPVESSVDIELSCFSCFWIFVFVSFVCLFTFVYLLLLALSIKNWTLSSVLVLFGCFWLHFPERYCNTSQLSLLNQLAVHPVSSGILPSFYYLLTSWLKWDPRERSRRTDKTSVSKSHPEWCFWWPPLMTWWRVIFHLSCQFSASLLFFRIMICNILMCSCFYMTRTHILFNVFLLFLSLYFSVRLTLSPRFLPSPMQAAQPTSRTRTRSLCQLPTHGHG